MINQTFHLIKQLIAMGGVHLLGKSEAVGLREFAFAFSLLLLQSSSLVSSFIFVMTIIL